MSALYASLSSILAEIQLFHRPIEDSDSEPVAKGKTTAPAAKPAPPVKKAVKSKWEGEDEEEEAPVVRRLAIPTIHHS